MAKKPGSKNAGTKRAVLTYKDYIPLRPGDTGYSKTARKYHSKSEGKTIGVGAFQKLAHGGKSYSARKHEKVILKGESVKQYRADARGTSYKEYITEYRDHINKERRAKGLPELSRDAIRRDTDFKEAYKVISKQNNKTDKSADGPLAQALVKMGRRQKEWNFPVGQS